MGSYEGVAQANRVALVYSEVSFRHSVDHALIWDELGWPDISHVIVKFDPAIWQALDASSVVDRLSDQVAVDRGNIIMDWFRETARRTDPDFVSQTIRTSSGIMAVRFVPSGIQVPGQQPPPTGYETYRCDWVDAHRVVRPVGSTGSVCGFRLDDGTSCPGILSVY